MNRVQRKHFRRAAILGLFLAIVAMLINSHGYLDRLEHALYDIRAVHCQRFRPPPSDAIVHLDIDETALDGIGAWPWPRPLVGDLLDEIALARPKVVAMDILFGEPTRSAAEAIDEAGSENADDRLADAARRLGCALIPISVSFDVPRPPGPIDVQLTDLLAHDPQLSVSQCVDRLRAIHPSTQLEAQVAGSYLTVRPQAIYRRIEQELGHGPVELAEIERRLLPDLDPLLTGSILRRLLREEYDRAMRLQESRRFTLPRPQASLPVLHASEEILPPLALCRAAAFSGYVNYLPDHVEGAVRSVPVVVEDHGRLFPQMALAAACAALDVDIHSLRVSADAVVIPRPGNKDIRIPVSRRVNSGVGQIGMLMDVPMFGPKDNWLVMYDNERRQRPLRHISLYKVYQSWLTRRRVSANEGTTDQVVLDILNRLDAKAATAYGELIQAGAAREPQVQQTLTRLDAVIAGLTGDTDADDDSRALLLNLKKDQSALRQLARQTDLLRTQLLSLRNELKRDLGGRSLFIGGTATGHDFHATTLHYACPGILIHASVFNAILTGKMWRRAGPLADSLATLGIGILVAALVTVLSPLPSVIASVLVIVAYLLFNGFELFDHHNLILGAAGPLVAGVLVCGGLTIANFVTEVAERARITRRFRSYVDPALVQFVLNNPEQSRLDGEVREMTMGFTDLAGFTSLTEKLGGQTVRLLSEYMGEMVPEIRKHRGFVSKLMGDGIYFFYGAPEPDPHHAAHAVATVLDMRTALAALNERLVGRNLPRLEMRAGISTGVVIIGDAGPADASDYTAMGDSVNLASRLESANKAFGSHALITGRTLELGGGDFLVRPIARLQVAGKTQAVDVYEPLARRQAATPEQRALAELTTAMITAYQAGHFPNCLIQLDAMEKAVGKSKLTALYRRLSESFLTEPPANFRGQVILNEK